MTIHALNSDEHIGPRRRERPEDRPLRLVEGTFDGLMDAARTLNVRPSIVLEAWNEQIAVADLLRWKEASRGGR